MSAGGSSLPTEFVVVLVGDGSAPLSSAAAPVVLQRRSITTGLVLSTLALPTSTVGFNHAFTLGGTSSAEGSLTLSNDRRALTLAGFGATPGTAAVQSSTAPRVVAVVRASDFTTPAVDTSTVLTGLFPSNSGRASVVDGTNLWVGGGSGGVFRTAPGSTAMPLNIATTPVTTRVLGIWAGQLYESTGSPPTGIYQVGLGLPVTSTTSMQVVATGSPYGFAMFDVSPEPGLDLLYVADELTGLLRFVKSGGAWTQSATFTPAVRHLACFEDGADVICLANASASLYRLRDTNHALAGMAMSTIGAAATNTAFRGLALMPQP
jgi:hypothetical protein